ncbi:hypothetical protein Trydic_g7087 [Trypoxylus dichotomus]
MVYFLFFNYIELVFLSATLLALFFGSILSLYEQQLPSFIIQTVRYGKFADRNKKSQLVVQVPKSWFRHFYIYSSILSTGALYLCINHYVYEKDPPQWVFSVLDYSIGNLRKPTVNCTRTLLTIFLLTLQCLRRLYDTNFVSVYGKNSKIHLGHYALGFLFYTGCVLTILGGAVGFTAPNSEKQVLQWSDLNMKELFATYLFLWAWWHQYKVTVILANLRKDEKGNTISDAYKLPKGGWFDAVSSPHNLAEILMYSSLTLIIWPNFTWWFIYLWVIVNQVEVALLSHWWYREKFEDYPKNRKIIFPYMY